MAILTTILFFLLTNPYCSIMDEAIQLEKGKFRTIVFFESETSSAGFDVKSIDPEVKTVVKGTTVTYRYFGVIHTHIRTDNVFNSINFMLTYHHLKNIYYFLRFGLKEMVMRVDKNELSTLTPGYSISAGIKGVIFPFTDFYPSLMYNLSYTYSNYNLLRFYSNGVERKISNSLTTQAISIAIQSCIKKIKFKGFTTTPYIGLTIFRQFNKMFSMNKDELTTVDGVNDGFTLSLGFEIGKHLLFELNYFSQKSISMGWRF